MNPTLGGWRRYVAVGDSFTEGLCDEDPDRPGRYLGWADRLASRLAEVHPDGADVGYANLAIRGRLLGQIVAEQVPAALALSADLVSLVGGANDLLRPGVDVDVLAEHLDAAVARIRASGADVLLATQVDPVGAAFFGRLRGRYATFSCHVHSIAIRHGCHVLDLWGLPQLRSSRMWAPDRLHLSSRGHQLVAQAAGAALELFPARFAAGIGVPVAEPTDDGPGPSLPRRVVHHAGWASEHLLPWIGRRLTGRSSGEHVTAKRPQLAAPQPLGRPSAGAPHRGPASG